MEQTPGQRPEQEQAAVVRVGPPTLSVNSVIILANPFDVTLDLAYRAGADPNADHVARVAMSWEHAQALVRVLQQQIDVYVDRVGDLPDVERLRAEGQPS